MFKLPAAPAFDLDLPVGPAADVLNATGAGWDPPEPGCGKRLVGFGRDGRIAQVSRGLMAVGVVAPTAIAAIGFDGLLGQLATATLARFAVGVENVHGAISRG
jgi:hypothetical protein